MILILDERFPTEERPLGDPSRCAAASSHSLAGFRWYGSCAISGKIQLFNLINSVEYSQRHANLCMFELLILFFSPGSNKRPLLPSD